jgi:hypothetical protein
MWSAAAIGIGAPPIGARSGRGFDRALLIRCIGGASERPATLRRSVGGPAIVATAFRHAGTTLNAEIACGTRVGGPMRDKFGKRIFLTDQTRQFGQRIFGAPNP